MPTKAKFLKFFSTSTRLGEKTECIVLMLMKSSTKIENTITPGGKSMVISIGHIFFLIKEDYF